MSEEVLKKWFHDHARSHWNDDQLQVAWVSFLQGANAVCGLVSGCIANDEDPLDAVQKISNEISSNIIRPGSQ